MTTYLSQSAVSSAPSSAWLDANQRHLSTALARIRSALQAHSSPNAAGASRSDIEIPTYESGAPVDSVPMALDRLVSLAGLSAFERDLLLLTAGVELDSSIAALCASIARAPHRSSAATSIASSFSRPSSPKP